MQLKRVSGKQHRVKSKEKQEKSAWSFSLPKEKSRPPATLAEQSSLIYGEAGIGKTSLVREFGKVLFFTWESASESISVFRTPLLNNVKKNGKTVLYGWQKALRVAEELERNRGEFDTVCFDTVRPAYDRCLEYVCYREHILHPGEGQDFGAGWKKVADEYHSLNEFLRGLGLSVISIAHERTDEISTRAGTKYFVIKPNISGQCETYYRGSTALIGYYYKLGTERYLQIVGDDYVIAKSNSEHNWRTQTGERVERVPMGSSSAQAYKNLVRAFVNKQKNANPAEKGGVQVIAQVNTKGRFGKQIKRERRVKDKK